MRPTQPSWGAAALVLASLLVGCTESGSALLPNGPLEPAEPAVRLAIVDGQLPTAAVEHNYSTVIEAVGGMPPYRWRFLSGGPDGISIASEGTPATVLSGKPSQTGEYSLRVQVEDARGAQALRSFTMIVQRPPPLRIVGVTGTAVVLADGEVDKPYRASVAAIGGTRDYSWQVSGGQLPDGLMLEAVGTPETSILGRPSVPGTFLGAITVTDSAGSTDTKSFELSVSEAPVLLEITTTSLAAALFCEAYTAEVLASGGVGPFQWTVVTGVLPPGMGLQPSLTSSNLTISGTPLRGSLRTYSLTLEVRDALGDSDTQGLTLSVLDSGANIPVALVGNLEEESRSDLFVADLCLPVPAAAARVSSNTKVNQGLRSGAGDQAWSPDGSKIAFIGDMDVEGSSQVYVAEVSGAGIGPPVRVSGAGWTADNDARSLKFSPDGRRLAFVADGRETAVVEMYVVDTSSAVAPDSAVLLTPPPSHTDAIVNDGLNSYRFSSNSEHLVFLWDEPIDGQNELWVADVANVVARSAQRATTSVEGGGVFGVNEAVPGGARFVISGELMTNAVVELFLVDAAVLPPTVVRVSAPLAPLGVSGLKNFGTSSDGAFLWYLSGGDLLRVDLANLGAPVQLSPGGFDEGQLLGSGPGLLVTDGGELFVFDVEGPLNQDSDAARVSADSVGGAYASSPSGRWVGYVTGDRAPRAVVVPMVGLRPQAPIEVSPPTSGLRWSVLDGIVFAPDDGAVVFRGRYSVEGQDDAYVVPLSGTTAGPWRQLTPNTVAGGDVSGLAFASPTQLLVSGDLVRRGDKNAFVIDISNPASLPVPITTRFIPGQSQMSRVLIP